MDRELTIRAGMFGTIIVLVALILVTPNLMGHPSELASLPVLIVAMTHNETEFIVDVSGAVQAYLYDNVILSASHVNPDGTNGTRWSYVGNDTYNAEVYVPVNATPLWIHTRLLDQQGNYFEYNVTVTSFNDTANGGRFTMLFTFPDDPGTAPRNVVPPSDFRWPVPRRGMVPS